MHVGHVCSQCSVIIGSGKCQNLLWEAQIESESVLGMEMPGCVNLQVWYTAIEAKLYSILSSWRVPS